MVLNEVHFGTFSNFLLKEGKIKGQDKNPSQNPSQAISDLFNLRPKPVSQAEVQQCSLAQQLHNLLGTRHPASPAQLNPAQQLLSNQA